MTTIFALIAGYFALLVVLSLIARPSRVRMAALAHELMASDPKPEHRQVLKLLLDSAYSMRSAPVALAGTIISLLTPSEKFDAMAREWVKENREYVEDSRWIEFLERHTLSVVAANPIFGAPLLFARLLFRIKAHLFARRRMGPPSVNPKTLEVYGELRAA